MLTSPTHTYRCTQMLTHPTVIRAPTSHPLMEHARWLCHFIDVLLAIDKLGAGSRRSEHKVQVEQIHSWETNTNTHIHKHTPTVFHLIYWSTPIFVFHLWPLLGEYPYGSSVRHWLIELSKHSYQTLDTHIVTHELTYMHHCMYNTYSKQ